MRWKQLFAGHLIQVMWFYGLVYSKATNIDRAISHDTHTA